MTWRLSNNRGSALETLLAILSKVQAEHKKRLLIHYGTESYFQQVFFHRRYSLERGEHSHTVSLRKRAQDEK